MFEMGYLHTYPDSNISQNFAVKFKANNFFFIFSIKIGTNLSLDYISYHSVCFVVAILFYFVF